ncbi:recombinase family protein [Paenibacillus sp. Root444D2]|uniref:recombinase family protein n=1 Tax=Paenibacillus sp. Root444D2 TaxID=1736538 RepID=UPI002E103215
MVYTYREGNKMAKIGYARVSTSQQSLALQLDALKAEGCERIFQEKESGRNDDREELAACLDYLRPGDTLIVYKLDRLGRSTAKLVNLVDDLNKREIMFASVTDKIDTSTAMGKAMLTILSAFAQLEADLIRERTRDGLEAARARGRVGGRKPQDSDKLAQALKLHASMQYTIKQIHEMTQVSKSVLYRAIKAQS